MCEASVATIKRLASQMTRRRNTKAPYALADSSNDAAGRLIAELVHKYLWWEPAGEI